MDFNETNIISLFNDSDHENNKDDNNNNNECLWIRKGYQLQVTN
jgi:hypothetical protein